MANMIILTGCFGNKEKFRLNADLIESYVRETGKKRTEIYMTGGDPENPYYAQETPEQLDKLCGGARGGVS